MMRQRYAAQGATALGRRRAGRRQQSRHLLGRCRNAAAPRQSQTSAPTANSGRVTLQEHVKATRPAYRQQVADKLALVLVQNKADFNP